MLIKDVLTNQAASDRVALVQGDREVSYRELHARCSATARLLSDNDATSGNVGIFLPNGVGYAHAYFATTLADRVVVPLNPATATEELASTIDYCETSTIVTDPAHALVLLERLAGFPARLDLLVLGDRDGDGNGDGPSWHTVNPAGRRLAVTQPLGGSAPDDVAVLLHTSGTTSRPKRVMLTHGNLIHNVRSNIVSLHLTEHDTSLIALPMFFGYCNSAQFLSHIFLGARCVVFEGAFTPKGYLDAIAQHDVTNATAVPSMLLALLAYGHRHRHPIDSLRLVYFGGGVMPVDQLATLFQEFPTVEFVQTYGQTEAGPRVSAVPVGEGRERIGSVGPPIAGVRIRIVDDSHGQEEVPPGTVGEITVRSPSVMRGYFKRPEATAAALRDGWLFTGDLGFLGQDGYLQLVGRKKNLVISGGRNIYPEEIEEQLLTHPAVREVCVAGAPHPLLGEVPVARVVLRPESPAVTPGQLRNYCVTRLTGYKVPAIVEIVEALPRTATGKVRRF